MKTILVRQLKIEPFELILATTTPTIMKMNQDAVWKFQLKIIRSDKYF